MRHKEKYPDEVKLKITRKAFIHIYIVALLVPLVTALLYIGGRDTSYWMWVVSAVVLVVGIKIPEFERFTTTYYINPESVIIEKGIFSKRRTFMLINNIVDVDLRQSFWQRMFNYGDLAIHTFNDETVNIGSINNPEKILPLIEKHLSGGGEKMKKR